MDLSVEEIKEYYLNNGTFYIDYPYWEDWEDQDWIEYAIESELER
tara:strand:- start:5449 stop:5583 length:135 start_codon:yes stop_codon:yes gene_type:complete